VISSNVASMIGRISCSICQCMPLLPLAAMFRVGMLPGDTSLCSLAQRALQLFLLLVGEGRLQHPRFVRLDFCDDLVCSHAFKQYEQCRRPFGDGLAEASDKVVANAVVGEGA